MQIQNFENSVIIYDLSFQRPALINEADCDASETSKEYDKDIWEEV